MEHQTYSTRELKLAITTLPNLAQKLFNVGKPYEELLKAILAIDRDYRTPLITDKRIMEEHHVKPHLYRKWLTQIYLDLLELMSDYENPQFEVNKIEHNLYWSERGKNFFLATTLPETPRIGSMLDIRFFHLISGRDFYYVDDVTYTLLDGKMIVDISLRSEFYNGYSKFAEEKEEHEEYQKGFWHWMRWREKKREEKD